MSTAPSAPPTAGWVTLAALEEDPFPVFERLRAEAPVAYVPAAGRYLVTTHADVHALHQDNAAFSSDEEGTLMKRSMGHAMLRKDDPEHAVERAALQPPLRPRAVKSRWAEVFEATARRYLDELVAAGPGTDGTDGTDLVSAYAAPVAAENLRLVMGFDNATQQDLQRWSQTMIDGVGNYADDPSVWADALRSSEEVDTAVDEMLARKRAEPDGSLLSGLAGEQGGAMGLDAIRANVKMTIGGGLNEPRDAIGTAVWALLDRPEQLATVLADPVAPRWADAFEEALRWVAPIGAVPRQTTRDVEVRGVVIPAGAGVLSCMISGNRDEEVFERPAEFDVDRDKKPLLSFGGGAHYCAGTWVAKASVAGAALPLLFERLPGLRWADGRAPRASGWVFRGPRELPVVWDSVTTG